MSLKDTLVHLWNPTQDLLLHEDSSHLEADAYLKKLQFQVHHRLGGSTIGSHKSPFKGLGLDLHNIREYQPGDEIRKMDWNVFARTGIPHVKEHTEERQIPIWCVVDATASMHFGQTQSKLAYVKQLVSTLGLIALTSGHRVGLILWTGKATPLIIHPKHQLTQLEWMVQEIQNCITEDTPQHLEGFPSLEGLFQNRGLLFFISDGQCLTHYPPILSTLAKLAHKHQLMNLLIRDPIENDMAYGLGWLPLQDTHSQEVVWVNTQDRWMIKEYRRTAHRQLEEIRQQLTSIGPVTLCHTHQTPLDILLPLTFAA